MSKKVDSIKIETKTINESESDTVCTPADTIITMNGKMLPYVYGFNLKQRADDLVAPCLDLELAMFENMFEFEGKANVNVSDIIIPDENIARQVYEKLKERFEGDDNE